MDLGQLAQHHHWPIAKNLDELSQRTLESLRGLEDDERVTGGRGSGNQSQSHSSLSGQETEHEKWTIDQPRSAHGSRKGGGSGNG